MPGTFTPSGAQSYGGGAYSYQPGFQGQNDLLFNQLLSGAGPGTLGATPSASGVGLLNQYLGSPAYNLYQQMSALPGPSNYSQSTMNPLWSSIDFAQMNQNLQLGNQGAAQNEIAKLRQAGNQVYQTAMDPQQALFNQLSQQVTNQQNALNAMSGVGSTPYGASVTGQNLSQFDIAWQNQQLARQLQGLQGMGQAYTGSQGLLAALEQANAAAGAGMGQAYNQNLGLGQGYFQSAFNPTMQLMNPALSYLNLGQQAAATSANIGNLGYQQGAQTLGGLGSLLGFGVGQFGTGGGLYNLFGLGGGGGDLGALADSGFVI